MGVMTAIRRSESRELVIGHDLNASRHNVFAAWTDPARMALWWGPTDFTNPICELDVRAAGAIRIEMRAPDGTIYGLTGAFREVAPPERLVFSSVLWDQAGTALVGASTTAEFAEQGGRTRVTVKLRAVGLVAAGVRVLKSMEAGWTQSLRRLEGIVAGA